jgi:integrase
MPLTLYRRHRTECEGGHPEDSRSGEFEEGRRGWKKCACLIHVSGTLAGKSSRKQTGKSKWDEAKAVATVWEKAQSWDGEVTLPEPLPDPAQRQRVTIEHAVKAFLAELQESISFGTHKKYRLLLEKFKEFSTARGYVMIDQWEPTDVREFRTSWAINPRTGARRMAMLKPFFEYCVSNEWITRNPARAVKNPKGRDMEKAAQRLPFTDEELKRMYDACPLYGDTPRHKWNGEDVADFISLSIYTGLRISDVALFNIDRMKATGEIRVRTTKTGANVDTWVPRWLQDRIRARAKIHGDYIFGTHTTKDLDVITEGWRRKLQKVWKLCGPWKVKQEPHRFRHTFARILLQKPGVTVRNVADLMGDTEEMILKHYGAWVPERQESLTRILREAFGDTPKPRPKLVALPGRN